MATTIGRLNVVLSASTAKFSKGLDRAAQSVGVLRGAVGRAAIGVAAFGAASAAAAVGGLTALAKQGAAAVDEIAKFSSRIGIGTEALAGLQHAAELTGVSTQTLNMGLQRMVRRIAEVAATGKGEATEALKTLALDAQRLAQLSPDEQFKAIAEAMRGVGSQGERVRLAMKLFDSEGVALLQTLSLGAQGLDEMAAEAEALGLSFSRVDAAQVEAANDAITRLKSVFTGVGRQLAILLAPMIELVAEKFTKMATSGSSVGEKVRKNFGAVVRVIAALVDASQLVKAAFFAVRGAIVKAIALPGKALNGLLRALQRIGEFAGIDVSGIVEINQALIDELDRAAAEQFDRTKRAFGDFVEGEASKKAERFLADLERRSREAAAAATGKPAPANIPTPESPSIVAPQQPVAGAGASSRAPRPAETRKALDVVPKLAEAGSRQALQLIQQARRQEADRKKQMAEEKRQSEALERIDQSLRDATALDALAIGVA